MQSSFGPLIWFFLGVGAWIAVNALLLTLTTRRRGDNTPLFAARWSLVDLWWGAQALVLSLFVLIAPLMIFVGLFARQLGLDKLNLADSASLATPAAIAAILLPSAILQNIGFFGVPAAFINLKYRLPLRAIGLTSLPSRREVRSGILLGIIAIVVSNLAGTGLHLLAEQFKHVGFIRDALNYEKTNPVAGMMSALPKLGVSGLILGVLGVGVAAPLGEEMLFRGFVFNILKTRLGLTVGLIGSALLFTVVHSYALGLLPVFIIGLLLAWAYHNTGSLWVSIIIHATNNTVGVLLAYFFPGLGV